MKKIIKNFNNSVKNTIFKVQNKTNDNFNISSFNKYLITIIGLLFFYIFYLLTPLLYGKTWIQTNIESKLLNEFRINLSTSANISYRILPSPHFLIKDSKMFVNDTTQNKSIAEIKYFQVFLSQTNFFEKKKLNIKRVVINDANFSLLRNELKLLNNFRNKKFPNKSIKVNNSNIFFKDNLGETISIIKLDKAVLFFDKKKQINFINLKGEVFNMPFILDFENHNDSTKYEKINFSSKSLKLKIYNESITKKKLISGKNSFSFLDSIINTKYDIKEKLITFKSLKSKLNNSQLSYIGKLSTSPFDLDLNINLYNHKISKLFDINLILIEFIKSKVLFNDNISVNVSTIVNSNEKNEIFQNAKINFHIVNGKIDLDKTKFINDEIGSLQLSNSSLFLKNNNLLFNGDILIDIKNPNLLFSFLNTNKLLRKNFKSILINLEYDFLSNIIKFNNIKIDDADVGSQLLTIIDGFSDNSLNNLNRSRGIFNEILKAYEG